MFARRWQGGELVAVLRGANVPQLQRLILDELAKEKLILTQGGERNVVSDSLPQPQPQPQPLSFFSDDVLHHHVFCDLSDEHVSMFS